MVGLTGARFARFGSPSVRLVAGASLGALRVRVWNTLTDLAE
jgi:hypothetical protein